MPIVGTAGHVDHGKSTLVLSLTGRDPDRWDEEKKRGLTIDLGFAWADLGDGTAVGFVDVPGHERFIKNMLAGVGALDVALLVVAADEGWMPQTEEHFAVLDLLDIGFGVVAVTRTDLVDADTLELAQLEVAEKAEGTSLESWPIVPVAAPLGKGLEELKQALLGQLALSGSTPDIGRPRLWVDRAFTIAGAGTVVTGTLTDGRVAKGDELWVWPGPHPVRVRAIQSHEEEVESVGPGSRTAINLAGLDQSGVERGACLTGPQALRASRQLLVSLQTVRTLDEPLSAKGAFHAHIGSGTWPVSLRPVNSHGREVTTALLSFDRDIAVATGDRFILREVGRRAVVAGGRVLDPRPPRKLGAVRMTVERLTGMAEADPDQRAQALLEVRGEATLDELSQDSGGGRPRLGTFTETGALSVERGADLLAIIAEEIQRHQKDNPLRDGAPRGELLTLTGLNNDMFAMLLDSDTSIVDQGATVRTFDFTGGWGDAQQVAFDAASAELEAAALAVPRASQLSLESEVLHAAIRSGRLIRIADDLVYLPEQILVITAGLASLPDPFTVAEFRDAFGLSRRQAVPLVEWLDSEGWTSRRGDVRTLRQPRPESR